MRLAEWMDAEGRRSIWLARLMGVSPSTVMRWRKGEHTPSGPARKLIERLSNGAVKQWETDNA